MKLPEKDFSISKKNEGCWWFQGRCPLKMRIQYDSKSKILDLLYYKKYHHGSLIIFKKPRKMANDFFNHYKFVNHLSRFLKND